MSHYDCAPHIRVYNRKPSLSFLTKNPPHRGALAALLTYITSLIRMSLSLACPYNNSMTTSSRTMNAFFAHRDGHDSTLAMHQVPVPVPYDGQVLIKVVAAGINRADIMQRKGLYPPPAGESEIIGVEVSGIIEKSLSPDFCEGQEVCALLAGGGYAEYVAVDARLVLPAPTGVPLIDVAAIPEVAATVWANIFMHAQLREGERLLVHGGSSGVGTHAIQFARYRGAKVAVTAGTADKLTLCENLGADITINYREQEFSEILRDQVDVILDIVGGDYLPRNLSTLRTYGRIVTIAVQQGAQSDINLALLMLKRASIMGSTLRAREMDGPWGKTTIIQGVHENVWPAYETAHIRPCIGGKFPFAQAMRAHQALESGKTSGKLLLVL